MRATLTITTKVIVVLLIGLVAVTAASGVYALFSQRRELYRDFERVNANQLERLAFVLAEPLWQVDTGTIERLVLFELREENVRSLVVTDEGGEPILAKRKLGGQIEDFEPPPLGSGAGAGAADPHAALEREISKDGQAIGRVRLEPEDEGIIGTLRAAVVRMVLQAAFLGIALVLSSFLSLEYLVVSPLRAIHRFVQTLSQGDLSRSLPPGANDEFGGLSAALNRFIASLTEMMGRLKTLSTDNSATGRDIALRLGEIAAAMLEIDRMTGSIGLKTEALSQGVSGSSDAADRIAEDLRNLVLMTERQGGRVAASEERVLGIIAAVERLSRLTGERLAFLARLLERTQAGKAEMKRTRDAILSISASVGTIDRIIAVIDEIADRSNLLAMNAAVTAAHAGQAGKSFAVVAGEIRRLSVTTSENARKVGETIKTITDNIRETESVTESTEAVISAVLGDMGALSADFSEILSTVQALAREGEDVGASLSEVTTLSSGVRDKARSIDDYSRGIKDSLAEVLRLSEETMRGVAEIKAGVGDTTSSVEALSAIGLRNSETVRVIEGELARFKTAPEKA